MPAIRETLEAIARQKLARKKKDEHYNSAGSEDAFSELIVDRLRALKISRAEFADQIGVRSTFVRYKRSRLGRTSPSNITRIIQGSRSVPLADVLGWAIGLHLGSAERIRKFAIIVALCNALRELRRKLPERHATRVTLEPMLNKALTKAVAAFTWQDGP